MYFIPNSRLDEIYIDYLKPKKYALAYTFSFPLGLGFLSKPILSYLRLSTV